MKVCSSFFSHCFSSLVWGLHRQHEDSVPFIISTITSLSFFPLDKALNKHLIHSHPKKCVILTEKQESMQLGWKDLSLLFTTAAGWRPVFQTHPPFSYICALEIGSPSWNHNGRGPKDLLYNGHSLRTQQASTTCSSEAVIIFVILWHKKCVCCSKGWYDHMNKALIFRCLDLHTDWDILVSLRVLDLLEMWINLVCFSFIFSILFDLYVWIYCSSPLPKCQMVIIISGYFIV